MKNPAIPTRSAILLCAAFAGLSTSHAQLYWDTNGTAPGAGVTADGTWDTTDLLWNTSADGTGELVAYTAGSSVVFSAGGDTTTATINLPSSSTVSSAFAMTIKAGTYQFTGSQIQNLSTITVESGATVTTANVRFNGAGNPIIQIDGNITSAQVISSGTLTKNGTGTYTSNGIVDANVIVNAGTLVATGGNKTKAVTINSGGTFRLAASNTIIDGNNVTVNAGGTLELSAGVTDTINQLSGTGNVTGGANSVLTVGNTAGTSTFSGTLSGDLALAKIGTGIFTFSGTKTSTGNITVSDGTFTLANTGSLTFYIGDDGVNNSITGAGTATFGGSFVFDLTNADLAHGNSWLIADVANQSFTGTFNVSGFTYDEIGDIWTNGLGLSFSQNTGVLSFTVIPEPSAFALCGGLASLAVIGLRRRRRA